MRHGFPTLRFALVAALVLDAGFGGALDAQERHVLTGDSAVIWNLAGEVRLEPGRGSDVVVLVTRGGEDGAQLAVNASGDRLTVRYPANDIVYRNGHRGSAATLRVRDDGTFGGGWDNGGRRVRVRTDGGGLEAHADLLIQVPAGESVALHLAVGEVTAENVDGNLRLDVHAASISTSGTKGRLWLDAGSGSVNVTGGQGELDVDTGSGSTSVSGYTGGRISVDAGSGTVTVRDVTASRLSVDVGSGSVRADALATDDLMIDTGSGGVELSLTRVPRNTDIDTGSGSVRLELPEGINADVHIETGSGGISSDFPVTMDRIERRELRGRIGTGGAMIRVSTGSGGVRLLKR